LTYILYRFTNGIIIFFDISDLLNNHNNSLYFKSEEYKRIEKFNHVLSICSISKYFNKKNENIRNHSLLLSELYGFSKITDSPTFTPTSISSNKHLSPPNHIFNSNTPQSSENRPSSPQPPDSLTLTQKDSSLLSSPKYPNAHIDSSQSLPLNWHRSPPFSSYSEQVISPAVIPELLSCSPTFCHNNPPPTIPHSLFKINNIVVNSKSRYGFYYILVLFLFLFFSFIFIFIFYFYFIFFYFLFFFLFFVFILFFLF
jgi:hypothetical protein